MESKHKAWAIAAIWIAGAVGCFFTQNAYPLTLAFCGTIFIVVLG